MFAFSRFLVIRVFIIVTSQYLHNSHFSPPFGKLNPFFSFYKINPPGSPRAILSGRSESDFRILLDGLAKPRGCGGFSSDQWTESVPGDTQIQASRLHRQTEQRSRCITSNWQTEQRRSRCFPQHAQDGSLRAPWLVTLLRGSGRSRPTPTFFLNPSCGCRGESSIVVVTWPYKI